jgi:hypothetical protein
MGIFLQPLETHAESTYICKWICCRGSVIGVGGVLSNPRNGSNKDAASAA